MSERCILAVRFTRAGSLVQVRKAVGGFLRYVQHRDLHPTESAEAPNPKVSGLLKYVAYRDQASARAELFGPGGTMLSHGRKAFAAFVSRSLEESRPQLYRGRDGANVDRRRAVYRMVISPERAQGLDLRQLSAVVVARLQAEAGVGGLEWMAAIHRNTAHPHVHLVLAGMRESVGGGFVRVDVTRQRLAAMKQALALEIQRQRGERIATLANAKPNASAARGRVSLQPALKPMTERSQLIRILPLTALARSRVASSGVRATAWASNSGSSVLALRSAARRYQHRMEREAEEEARRRGWERAA
jgi:hypothetical protein